MTTPFIHKTSEIDSSAVIGDDTKIWHFSHVLGNTSIGENCNIGQNVVIGPDVTIGENCKIQNNVSVYKGVTLEDEVFCGPSVVFTNVFNPRSAIRRMDEIRPTLVKKGASLGANSTIVCGITIGKYAFVGAGAVVTRDVPAHALVMGNPARQCGWMCECGEKLDIKFECGACGRSYQGIGRDQDEESPIAFADLAAQQQRILPEIQSRINKVLSHGAYIMGPEVAELEGKLAKFTGAAHAVSCASGTDALVMALMAAGIGPGDAVFTTPFTFIATAEAVCLTGAVPVFVDIDMETFNLSAEKLEAALSGFVNKNLVPKAVVPVDLFGLPCDYKAIHSVAMKYKLVVIEDAAQSFGGQYNGHMAGALGDMGCTSFFPAKPLGCYGDGGAVFTDSDDLASKLRSIRIHGKGKDKYDNVRIGINGRLDTIQAAILLAKFEIFSDEINRRNQVADRYQELLTEHAKSAGWRLPGVTKGCKSAWAQYSIMAGGRKEREDVLARLKRKNIPSAVYYPTPLHQQTAYKKLGYTAGDFPGAETAARRIFSLPMHPYLSFDQQKRICRSLIQG